MEKKKISIKTNVRFNELQQYKKKFVKGEVEEVHFQMYIDNINFPATLKYGLVPARLKYDRKNKFKIYLDGTTNDIKKKKAILDLQDLAPSKPLLMMEMLYAKDKEEVIMLDNGDIEYHFTFLQY